MSTTIERLFGLDGIDRRLTALGIALVVGSVTLSAVFLMDGDLVTGVSILLYVVVGLLFAAIGVSPDAGTGPDRQL